MYNINYICILNIYMYMHQLFPLLEIWKVHCSLYWMFCLIQTLCETQIRRKEDCLLLGTSWLKQLGFNYPCCDCYCPTLLLFAVYVLAIFEVIKELTKSCHEYRDSLTFCLTWIGKYKQIVEIREMAENFHPWYLKKPNN